MKYLVCLVAFLLWRWLRLLRKYHKLTVIDEGRMLRNRKALLAASYEDYEKGRITREFWHQIVFFFHPDFLNIFDYVPPERREYTLFMNKLDKKFWKHYGLKPDFVIPPVFVYELYKDYFLPYYDEARRLSQLKRYEES